MGFRSIDPVPFLGTSPSGAFPSTEVSMAWPTLSLSFVSVLSKEAFLFVCALFGWSFTFLSAELYASLECRSSSL